MQQLPKTLELPTNMSDADREMIEEMKRSLAAQATFMGVEPLQFYEASDPPAHP